ncbi:MAG: nidogen-like domain-containing protein [Acidimicrobiales bacterium]
MAESSLRHVARRSATISVLVALLLVVPVSATAAAQPDKGQSAAGTAAQGATPPEPRVPGAKPAAPTVNPGESDREITVKFSEGTAIRLRDGRLVSIGRDDVSGLNRVLAQFPGATVDRLFDRPESVLADEKVALEQKSGRVQADLNLYYRIQLPEGSDATAALTGLNRLPTVEVAYAAPLPSPVPVTPSFVGEQGYRTAATNGVDADFAATRPGGKGQNVRIVDVEYSWNQNHEDLAKARQAGALIANGTASDPFNDDDHGTAVLGQLIGDENSLGVTGVASGAGLGLTNANTTAGYRLANAIDVARAALAPGDVILIEQQAIGPNGCHATTQVGCVAVEWVLENYDAITRAIAAGVIVVEAAGNGAQNLNDAVYGSPFPSGRPDSGAIIVGAGAAPGCTPPARGRLNFSNHGTRVDVQGWGECVVTTGYGDRQNTGNHNEEYTRAFGGTSSASPIVASAAAVVSSVAEQTQRSLTPRQVRALLKSTGTAQDTSGLAGNIGPLPNLRAAIEAATAPGAIIDCGNLSGVLARNDDGSTPRVSLPFGVNFYGTVNNSLFVNNNGNVTFQSPLATYTPFTIAANTPPIIAPFFADVDTRGTASGVVRYGATTYGGRPAFCVNWIDVGYFSFHTDKTNSFQLLLVDRSDSGPGDFDIYMNYDRIRWETGDASGGINGFGGVPAGAGFSAGDNIASHFFQYPGSRTTRALIDDNQQTGLVNGSRSSQQKGRYLFPIRNGLAPGSSTLTGTVRNASAVALGGAPVQACRQGDPTCVTTLTNANGQYTLSAVAAGTWNLTAFPPTNSSLLSRSSGPFTVAPGATVQRDFTLLGPTGPPPDTSITNHGTTASGVPVLYWREPLTLQTNGCAGGTASYEIRQGTTVLRSGPMAATPAGSGHYVATVAALYPAVGNAEVRIHIACPNPADNEDTVFTIYIDPSGVVKDTQGNPLSGATVTLYRSDALTGPFSVVPSGSAIMSPSNRTNPFTTGSDGVFHWDVIAGFYKVRAEKAGCMSPTSPTQAFVETGVLTIPPPALDLVLTLSCQASTTTNLASSVNPSVTGQPVVFTATVAGSGSTPTGSVQFKVDGVNLGSAQPLAGGQATSPSATSLSPGNRSVTAEYGGSAGFAPSTGSLVQVVSPAATTMTLSAAPSPSSFGQAVTFAAKVIVTPPGSGSPGGTVSFYLGSIGPATLLGTSTLNAGQASFTTAGLPVGTSTIVARYDGDTRYLASQASASQSVSCARTVTGSVKGPIDVTSGTCIQSATEVTTLTVRGGGAVVVTDSNVQKVESDGATGVTLCNTKVAETVTIRNSTGFVIVGNQDDGNCLGNHIGGKLTLENNQRSVEIAGNQLSRGLAVNGTTGTGFLGENTRAEIEANVIAGDLACATNSPEPINDGRANTVTGVRSGQCAGATF